MVYFNCSLSVTFTVILSIAIWVTPVLSDITEDQRMY